MCHKKNNSKMAIKKSGKKQKNVTFIGTKSVTEYVRGIATQFTHKKEKEMIIKARGRNMEKAIEVCEKVKNKFKDEKPVMVQDAKIGQEKLEEDGKTRIVQTIEIKLKQK